MHGYGVNSYHLRMTSSRNDYSHCMLCPRSCGVDRLENKLGFCSQGSEIRLALASIHKGEEPPVTGKGGSGTMFFSGCTLRCSFCQNFQISQEGYGKIITPEEFAALCIELEKEGAENINLVTGTQFTPGIIEGLKIARARGLTIPSLWNTSGYETVETIEKLSEDIRVWLPDLKTLDSKLADNLFKAPDYPEAARASILKMTELTEPQFNDSGVLTSGVIVRHLVLPGMIENTQKVLAWFSENLSGRAILSLMTQYTPIPNFSLAQNEAQNIKQAQAAPQRYLEQSEYETVLHLLEDYGIEDGFYQELVQDSQWLPDFRKQNPFSSELAKTVWHC